MIISTKYQLVKIGLEVDNELNGTQVPSISMLFEIKVR